MGKEILLYGGIHDYSAELFINQIGEAEESGAEEIKVCVNSNGGSPEAMYGMAAKLQSFQGKVNVSIHGKARSAGAFLPLYADHVEALDVSSFMFHRASWGSYFEAHLMDEETKAVVVKINADLRKAMEAKLDIPKFEKITKKTLDEIFSMETRIDVSINAKQAKEIGLVDNIIKITPKKKKALNAEFQKIAAEFGTKVDLLEINSQISTDEEIQQIKTKMNIQELQTKHPELYAEAKEAGIAEGVSKEKERVSAWLELGDADAQAVSEGIANGAEITTSEAIKILKASEAKKIVANAEAANTEDLDGEESTEAKAEGGEESAAEGVLAEMKEIRKNKNK